MIPDTAKLIRERVECIKQRFPYVSDKEVYWRVIDTYYVKLGERLIEKLCDPRVPGPDTISRRGRELKEAKRNRQPQMSLI